MSCLKNRVLKLITLINGISFLYFGSLLDSYKGYIETKGKAAVEKFKNKTRFKTYEQVKDLPGFGGVLENDTILIDIDDYEQSEIMMDIVEDYQLDCRVYQTTRGRHFLFKNHQVTRNHTHVPLAVGLTADIKCGTRTSYEVIKINGEERFIEWDIEEGGTYQELPKWMLPVKAATDFLDMDAGDGRNQALFNYILTLTANGFTVDETREAIRILNKYVLKESLSDEELEVILRDEAFQKPVFFNGTTFLFERFADWLKSNCNVVRINGQLHVYEDGIYQVGYGTILYFRETDPDKTTLDFGATVSVKRTGGGVNGVIEFEVTMTVQTDITYTDPA